MRRVSLGAIVDMSTQSRSDPAPSATPPGPSRTASTCGPSTTIVIATSASAAASAGVAATFPPCTWAHCSAFSPVRFQTVSS